MKALDAMIGTVVIVETVGKKEVTGRLIEVESLSNGIFGNSYILGIDQDGDSIPDTIIPMPAIYRITTLTAKQGEKEGGGEKKQRRDSGIAFFDVGEII